MRQLPSLVLLGQAQALEAAADGVVPAENIHSAVEAWGGRHLFGCGTCFTQGFLLEKAFLFSPPLSGKERKEENSVTWGTEEN